MTKATTETDRIAELEATVLALTKRVNKLEERHEERLDEQSGRMGALATALMVQQLATRVEDVGKRLGFTEQKQTIEAALSMLQWPAEGERASKMLAAAQQTSGAAFDWIEKMMEPLLKAWDAEVAERRMREDMDRQFEEDGERGSIPVGFFNTLKAADRTHTAQVGTFDDVRQGHALSTPGMDRFYTP